MLLDRPERQVLFIPVGSGTSVDIRVISMASHSFKSRQKCKYLEI